jgi:thiol-disulfide isomerase/thioredoxin
MFVVAFIFLVLPATAAVSPPEVKIQQISDLPTPLPYPFNEKADARADVDAAFVRARHNGKRVLIDLGGNWCADCRILAGIMQLPEVEAFIDMHYEVVTVDVGHFQRNFDIPRDFGIERVVDVPMIIIADPDGGSVNVSDASELSDVRHMTPQGVADWLARWADPED